MSTRSVTRIKTDLGTKEIYRHSDGYPYSDGYGMIEEYEKNLWRINEEVELTKRVVNEDNLNSDERDLVIKNMWRKISYIVRDETLNWVRSYENNNSYRGDNTFTTYSDGCIYDERSVNPVDINWFYNINLTKPIKVLEIRDCVSVFKGGNHSLMKCDNDFFQDWIEGSQKYYRGISDTNDKKEIEKIEKEYGEKFFEPTSYENTKDYKSFNLYQKILFKETDDKYESSMNTKRLLERFYEYTDIKNLYYEKNQKRIDEWKNLTDGVLNQPINDDMELNNFKTTDVGVFIEDLINENQQKEREEKELETIKN